MHLDDSSDSRRTGNVIVLLGDRNGTCRLPLEPIAVERAVSRVATGDINGGGRAEVIVAHRQSDCIAVPCGHSGARIDKPSGSSASLRA